MKFLLPMSFLVASMFVYSSGLTDETTRAKTREVQSDIKRKIEEIEGNLSNQTLQPSAIFTRNAIKKSLAMLGEIKVVLSKDAMDMGEFNELYLRFEEIRPILPALEKIKPLMDSLRVNREMCVIINPCDKYDEDGCTDVSTTEDEFQASRMVKFRLLIATAFRRVARHTDSVSLKQSPALNQKAVECSFQLVGELLPKLDLKNEALSVNLKTPLTLQDCYYLIDPCPERPIPVIYYFYTKSLGEQHPFDALEQNRPSANKACVRYFADSKNTKDICETAEDRISDLRNKVELIEEQLIGLTIPQAFHNHKNDVQKALKLIRRIKDFLAQDTFDEKKFQAEFEKSVIDLEIPSLIERLGKGLVMCIEISACDEYDTEECFANSNRADLTTSEKAKFELLLTIAVERVKKHIKNASSTTSRSKENLKAFASLLKIVSHLDKAENDQKAIGLEEVYLPIKLHPEGPLTSVVFFYLMGPGQVDHMFDPLIDEFLPAHGSCITVVGLEDV